MGYARKFVRVGQSLMMKVGLRPSGRVDSRRQKRNWERVWSTEVDRDGSELDADFVEQVPDELKEAVVSGWFPAGASVIDIGSGRGQVAAWLAEQGYAVLGAELSEAGTELARKHFGHISEKLEFEAIDICRDELEPGRFGALVDRGCFHGLPPALKARYVRNVSACAAPGAAFLLLSRLPMRVAGDESLDVRQRAAEEGIRKAFGSSFEIESVAPTIKPMRRVSGPMPRVSNPGIACWMRRR